MHSDLIEPLISCWRQILPGATIDRRSHFFDSGADSLAATAMCLEIERQTGCVIPVGQIYLTPVLEEFAAVLAKFDPDNRAPLFIPLKNEGILTPVFGIAPAMGGVFHFRELAASMDSDHPFHVIEPRVSASGAHAYTSLRDLAERALKVVRGKQPQGPYRFAGFSFGGPLAWEMAKILEDSGEVVDCLILLDSSSRDGYRVPETNPSWSEKLTREWRFIRECRGVRAVYSAPFRTRRWIPLLWQKFIDSVRTLPGTSPNPPAPGKETKPGRDDMDVETQQKLRNGYDPGFYGGRVYLFRAERQLTLHRELDYDLGWTPRTGVGQLRIITVPGDHFSLLKPPHVASLSSKIKQTLDQADRDFCRRIERETGHAGTLQSLPLDEPVNGECYSERFREVAKTYPDHAAIRDGGMVLSYAELFRRAEAIAAWLLDTRPGSDAPVLLHFDTNWQFICSLLGVLLAGRCYVPVDPEFPDLRIREIITLSGAETALSLEPERLENTALKAVSFDDACRPDTGRNPALPRPRPESPAVLLFTSGSTGHPKGTVVTRKMLLHVCWRRGTSCHYSPADRYALVYTSAFMGGVMAIHSPLMFGLTLCVYNLRRRGIMDLPHWMRREKITILHMITSILRRFLGHWNGNPALPDLRLFIPGGERARKSDIEQWKACCEERVRFATCLGSTECGTIAVNPLPMGYDPPDGPLPVGRPFTALNAKILREDGSEADPNEEGQLVIESEYIFRGYLNADELNKTVIAFSGDGKSVYKTGDFGYFDESGILYNCGRRDSRVKINGNLVELAEIESVLMESGMVDEVAVVHRPLAADDSEWKLVAFYRATPSENLESRLAEWLFERLPRIMQPARWVSLPRFPETVNGKTDRKGLCEVELH